jgi:hypothetical protein
MEPRVPGAVPNLEGHSLPMGSQDKILRSS